MTEEKTKEQDPLVSVRHGFLTNPDDPTVGGGGLPYAGIGIGQLPEELQHIGKRMRQVLASPNN